MTELHWQKKDSGMQCILVWDIEDSPPADYDKTLLWRSCSESVSSDVISIPNLVEENADYLRKRYLSWVYELGEMQVHGKRLVDHLELRPGFSYWWMTLLAEKCNFAKSPQINVAIKLMAFESWIADQSIGHVVLVTSNAPLADCINSWCSSSGIVFEWQSIPDQSKQSSWRHNFYRSLPYTLQALLWLALYLFQRWPLKGVGLQDWRYSEGGTTFVSYLLNLVPNSLKASRFESKYWGNLPNDLLHDGCKTNWLHIYIKDALLPTARKAAAAIRQFNATGLGCQVHVTLDTFLGWRVVFKAVRDWLHIRRLGIQLQNFPVAGQRAAINLWPLLKDDWWRSFVGQEALVNLLNLNLYEAALGSLPSQRVGVYLQENQSWEFAFIQTWKTVGHGRLIGTPHSTVRFWDLRYFFDTRNYDRQDMNRLPVPDRVALNGPAALDAYWVGGYPAQDLTEVEALRYFHLVGSSVNSRRVLRSLGSALRVLVIGEYLLSQTVAQMSLLQKATQFLPANTLFTLKSHPACPVKLDDVRGIKVTVTMEPLDTLLVGCDVVFTCNITSAGVDAYCKGVPVVSMLDSSILNLSPLRGCDGIIFVSTPEELADALLSQSSFHCSDENRKDFFILDPMLPRWRKLLLA